MPNAQSVLQVGDADRFRFSDADPAHLTANQVSDAVALWQTALTKQYLYGIVLENLKELSPDFPDSKLLEYVRQIHQFADEAAQNSWSKAHERTMQRLKAAGYDTRWGTPENPDATP